MCQSQDSDTHPAPVAFCVCARARRYIAFGCMGAACNEEEIAKAAGVTIAGLTRASVLLVRHPLQVVETKADGESIEMGRASRSWPLEAIVRQHQPSHPFDVRLAECAKLTQLLRDGPAERVVVDVEAEPQIGEHPNLCGQRARQAASSKNKAAAQLAQQTQFGRDSAAQLAIKGKCAAHTTRTQRADYSYTRRSSITCVTQHHHTHRQPPCLEPRGVSGRVTLTDRR